MDDIFNDSKSRNLTDFRTCLFRKIAKFKHCEISDLRNREIQTLELRVLHDEIFINKYYYF